MPPAHNPRRHTPQFRQRERSTPPADLVTISDNGTTWHEASTNPDRHARIRTLTHLARITVTVTPARPGPGAFGTHHYHVTITRPGRPAMTVTYHTAAPTTTEPDAGSVMAALCAESSALAAAHHDYTEWLTRYGFTHDRTTEDAFTTLLINDANVRNLLGTRFADFAGEDAP